MDTLPEVAGAQQRIVQSSGNPGGLGEQPLMGLPSDGERGEDPANVAKSAVEIYQRSLLAKEYKSLKPGNEGAPKQQGTHGESIVPSENISSKTQEEAIMRPGSYGSTSTGIVPTDFDILLGRGKSNKNWPGNKNFQLMINRNRELYFSGLTQYEKKTMTSEIVESVKRHSGRFLKMDKDTHQWIQISDEAARTKVAHALQYRNRQRTGKGTSARAIRPPPSPPPEDSSSHAMDASLQGQEKFSEQNTITSYQRDQAERWKQFLPEGARVVSSQGLPSQKSPLKPGMAAIATFDGQKKSLSFSPRSRRGGGVPSPQRRSQQMIVPQASDDVDTDRLAEEYWQNMQAQSKKDETGATAIAVAAAAAAASPKSQKKGSGKPKGTGNQAEAASMLLRLATRP